MPSRLSSSSMVATQLSAGQPSNRMGQGAAHWAQLPGALAVSKSGGSIGILKTRGSLMVGSSAGSATTFKSASLLPAASGMSSLSPAPSEGSKASRRGSMAISWAVSKDDDKKTLASLVGTNETVLLPELTSLAMGPLMGAPSALTESSQHAAGPVAEAEEGVGGGQGDGDEQGSLVRTPNAINSQHNTRAGPMPRSRLAGGQLQLQGSTGLPSFFDVDHNSSYWGDLEVTEVDGFVGSDSSPPMRCNADLDGGWEGEEMDEEEEEEGEEEEEDEWLGQGKDKDHPQSERQMEVLADLGTNAR